MDCAGKRTFLGLAVLLLWGWIPPLVSAEVDSTQTVLGLYPTGQTERQHEQTWFEYRSHPIHPEAGTARIVRLDQLRLKNWAMRWAVQVADGTIRSVSPDSLSLQETQPFTLICSLAYQGPLSLNPAQLQATRPEVLLVPGAGLWCQPKSLDPPWYKRLFGAKTPVRYNARETTPTHIVMILMDTLRPDHTPPYGHPQVIAPHLDMLASLGVLFENAYGASSSTRPSCGSIFSGLHPPAHGAVRHATDGAALHPGVRLFSQDFQTQQFDTAYVSCNAQVTELYGFDKGYAHFECPVWESQVTPRGLALLQTLRSPFFLYLHYLAPHQPYEPPALLASIYEGKTATPEEALYCGEITLDDRRVGVILRELAEQGILESTLIWLLSDHGEEFWEHGWNGHGANLYEESVRTVSIVTYPRFFQPGSRVEALVSHVDVYPTLAALLDWDTPPSLQGVSLLPLLRGTAQPLVAERPLFLHHGGGANKGVHESDKEAVLAQGMKMVQWTQKNQWELYDLKTDPQEKRNLTELAAAEAEAHGLRLLLKAQLETCEILASQYRVPIDETEAMQVPDHVLDNMRHLGYIE
ncbi:MAG: sulfatase [bacterium]|jgi:arylsulfatase A-like enzyme|nr:sulfatase [bacterium]